MYVQCCILRPHYFFFFNDTATTEIYTLSLHDALPIFTTAHSRTHACLPSTASISPSSMRIPRSFTWRSEEHTSELQSQSNLVCRLLLEKKNKRSIQAHDIYSESTRM